MVLCSATVSLISLAGPRGKKLKEKTLKNFLYGLLPYQWRNQEKKASWVLWRMEG